MTAMSYYGWGNPNTQF